jgi:hypothetical protein
VAAPWRSLGVWLVLLGVIQCGRPTDERTAPARAEVSAPGPTGPETASPDAAVAEASRSPAPSAGGTSGPARKARTIRPLSAGKSGCIEMYSACFDRPEGRTCTSAPFVLDCGESGSLPSTGELVSCVCP